MFRFQQPLFLLMLLIIPLAIITRRFIARKFYKLMPFSSVNLFERISAEEPFWKRHAVIILLFIAFSLFTIALARPQTRDGYININSDGVDIVIVLDLSNSMSFVDGIPSFLERSSRKKGSTRIYIDEEKKAQTRLKIAKKILTEFVDLRKQDRIGLVVFSDYPYTESPVTISHEVIKNKIQHIDFSRATGKSTAMGDAIVSAINKLRHSKSKSKIIILTTDGNSNKGEDPIAMAKISKQEGIKIYTIGIGGEGDLLKPQEGLARSNKNWTIYQKVPDSDGERLDKETLKQIAQITGGKFYIGSKEKEIRQIYNEIDLLEKSKSPNEKIYVSYEERYLPFVIAGLILIVIAFILENTILRILP